MMKFSAAPRFNFFSRSMVEDPDKPGRPFRLDGESLVAATCGRGLLTLGLSDGTILQLDRQMAVVRDFKGYQGAVLACHQVRQQDVLVTVGEDDGELRIKVWNLAKTAPTEGSLFCTSIFPVGNPPRPQRSTAATLLSGVAMYAGMTQAQPPNPSPVTSFTPATYACLDVHEGLTHMVVGTESGLVQMMKGDVTRTRSRRHILHQDSRPITAVSLRLVESGGGRGRSSQHVLIFVATDQNIISFLCYSGRSLSEEKTKHQLLNVGVAPGCASPMEAPGPVSQRDALFAVACEDVVRVFDATGESKCFGFEGSKVAVKFFKNYLLLVTRETKPGGAGEVHILTAYDLTHQFIAHSSALPAEAKFLLTQWAGAVVVICKDGSAHCIVEADLQSKLHLLFTKKNYDLAVRIAKSHNLDADSMADIFRRYGDYLYKKGDMDGAMNEYIRTIGSVEASYVIRRFLDASRIHNLTAYLRELHTRRLATADHTTLLLNCYTKLHDENSLNLFITSDDSKVLFNAETAIKVLRQAGYYALALVLAKKYAVHAWFVKIQVENMTRPDEALRYIEGLDTNIALRFMDEYGKLLMAQLPDESTALLRNLCARQAESLTANGGRLEAHMLEDYRIIFINNRPGWIEFLEAVVELQLPHKDAIVRRMLLDQYLDDWSARGGDAQLEAKMMTLLEDTKSEQLQEALVSCHIHDFERGYLLMCTRLGEFDELLRYHMDRNNHSEVLSLCERHGTANVDLWVQAIDYFAKRERQCSSELHHVLTYLREHHIMSPLMVVRMLANNANTASLAVVKQYILHQLEAEDKRIEEEEDLINSYKRQIEEHKAEVRRMEGAVKIFQNQKCSICKHDLDLPAVFFFCDHSYHQECFLRYSEKEEECPRCAEENAETRDRLAAWRMTEEDRRSAFFFSTGVTGPELTPDDFDIISREVGRPGFARLRLEKAERTVKIQEPKTAPQPEAKANPERNEPKVEKKAAPVRAEPKPLTKTETKPAPVPVDPRRAAALTSMTEQAKVNPARQARNIFQDGRRPPATASPSSLPDFAPRMTPATATPPKLPTAASNPFEDDSKNPFEDEMQAESKKEETEDEVYPDELNPFA